MAKPTPHYDLKADIARRGLTLRQVAIKARVPYTRASEILNGHRIDPVRLTKLIAAIRSFRLPQEVTA